ncbi:MAG: ATP-binding protein [Kiritimatiellae bacterium]|nr:ATP-binding protein [Kiritimatiellia bacterium]MDW8458758.1 ATP-binding protein [Verrucomicrobiota bacterium]
MKSGFLEKLIERLDRLDAGSLQTQFLRLAQEKGLLETIFHAIQEGIIVLDGEGRITYANRAAEKLLGFSAEQAANQPIKRYFREVEWDRVLDLDADEWSRVVSREIEISYPERRFLDFYIVPLRAVNERERGAVLMLRDVTRDRESETRTIESERLQAIMLLAAGVAHEIGNPLNSLMIHLQLLDRELAALPEESRRPLQELLDISRREVERLDQIITQFLKALRPSRPAFERASLRELLDETLDFLRHEIADRDVIVEVEVSGEPPFALVDRGQIKQVFFNIIRNAIQAMQHGGVLRITLSSDDRFVWVSFKDSGPGIPASDLGSIFEPYFTTKPEGSGLGLMIVQRVVRDHGGEIEVHSDPNSGTTFTVFLPRDERRIRLLRAREPDTANSAAASGDAP